MKRCTGCHPPCSFCEGNRHRTRMSSRCQPDNIRPDWKNAIPPRNIICRGRGTPPADFFPASCSPAAISSRLMVCRIPSPGAGAVGNSSARRRWRTAVPAGSGSARAGIEVLVGQVAHVEGGELLFRQETGGNRNLPDFAGVNLGDQGLHGGPDGEFRLIHQGAQ